MGKTTLQDVRERIAALKEQRRAELSMVEAKRREAQAAAEKAEAELDDAIKAMDADRYEKASLEKRKATAALEMFGRHHDMLMAKELISEAESDAVIDSLLAYEAKLDVDVHEAIAGPLQKLEKIIREYRDEVRAVEDTLVEWQREIHANFRSFDRTQYRDAEGNLTSRSETPLPVHRIPYQGNEEALRVDTFLTKNALLTASRSES